MKNSTLKTMSKAIIFIIVGLCLLNTNLDAQKLSHENRMAMMKHKPKSVSLRSILANNTCAPIKRMRSTAQRLIAIAERNKTGILQDSTALFYHNSTHGFIPSNSSESFIILDFIGGVNTPDMINKLYPSTFKELADREYHYNNANILIDSSINIFGTNHKLLSIYANDLGNGEDSTITYYNSNEKPIQRRSASKYPTISPNWVSEYREFYSYNADNLINEIDMQELDTLSGIWLDVQHDSMYYTGNDLTLIRSLFFDSTTMSWNPFSKVELTYNLNGKPLTVTRSEFDGTSWENISRIVYNYNISNQQTSSISEEWMSGAWQHIEKDSLIYASSSMPSEGVTFVWDTILNVWKNKFKYEAQYNSDAQILIDKRYSWNSGTSVWDAGNVTTFYYGNNHALSLSDTKNETQLMVYPSPTNELLFIKNLSEPINKLIISDLNGKRYMNLLENKSVVDVSGLPSGLYFISATIGNKEYHSKFIKE